MERILVKSSSLKSVGYNPVTQILEVEFVRGVIYQYSNINAQMFYDLQMAESIGSYFAKNIQKCPDLYSCEKVTE